MLPCNLAQRKKSQLPRAKNFRITRYLGPRVCVLSQDNSQNAAPSGQYPETNGETRRN